MSPNRSSAIASGGGVGDNRISRGFINQISVKAPSKALVSSRVDAASTAISKSRGQGFSKSLGASFRRLVHWFPFHGLAPLVGCEPVRIGAMLDPAIGVNPRHGTARGQAEGMDRLRHAAGVAVPHLDIAID